MKISLAAPIILMFLTGSGCGRLVLTLPPGQGPSVVTSDTFNRADTSSGLGSTDAGLGGASMLWTALAGTLGIQSHQVNLVAASPPAAFTTVASGYSNCTIQLTVSTQPATGFAAGLVARAQDASNAVFIGADNQSVAGAPGYSLVDLVGGTPTLAKTSAKALANGDVLTVAFSGSNYVVAVNGTSLFTQSDSNFLAAKNHGIFFGALTSTARITNFIVQDCQ